MELSMNISIRAFSTTSLTMLLALSSQTAFSKPTVKNDSVFMQSTIVGKVFHDRNGNGHQDSNEEGIPGVRLVNVEGLVIESDGYGRFHIPDRKAGNTTVGASLRKNVLIKVDKASLPDGAVLTTENPRLLSLGNSTLNRIHFGVSF